MSVTVLDSDSSDSDIFVIKQIKPINDLTLQQALLIKHEVLTSFQYQNSIALNKSKKKKKKKKKDDVDTHKKSQKSKKNKHKKSTDSVTSFKSEAEKSLKDASNEANTQCTVKKEALNIYCENTEILFQDFVENIKKEVPEIILKEIKTERVVSPLKITDYFSSTKVSPEEPKSSEKRKINFNENIQVSPGISKKRKKVQMLENTSPESSKYNYCANVTFDEAFVEKKEKKLFSTCISELKNDDDNDFKNEEKLKDFFTDNKYLTKNLLDITSSCYKEENEQFRGNSELMSLLLKKIIQEETKKQIMLEEKSFNTGKSVEKLLTENDCDVLEKFFNLNQTACKIYVRMLCRKKDWHRLSTISYKDINGNLKEEFELLSTKNFVDVNIEEENLKTQMDLLSKSEVQQLCKAFNVAVKFSSSNKKDELINFLIEDCKNQKSVLEMIKMRSSRSDILRSEIKDILGMCVKLNESALSTFKKIMLLFSFPHYNDEENKRFSNQLFMCVKVFKNMVRFPNYKWSPTVVFEAQYDFEEYQKALSLYESFEIAIDSKKHEDFTVIGNKAREEFCKLIGNEVYLKRFMDSPPFLKKFSAGTIYARILTKYCSLFKKKTDIKEIIIITQILLGQNLFLPGKRGKWYEILSQAHETLKESSAAAEVLVRSLNDPCIDEVQKLTLQLRGQALLKKKTNCVRESNLREVLDDLCTISVREPASIEIKGKALQGNESGYKCVYIEERENWRIYTSVEERAILHYKSNGFTSGCHSEGFIIHSIYFLIFFEIIYGPSPPGVFQSLYQEAPLDFYSKSFYLNRKEAIDSLLNEMCEWTEEEVEMKLKTVYQENFNVSCVITWKENFTPELFCEIIRCITMPVLSLICRRLVRNFRLARSGFPDLTLWNSETKKCKFVEVKSPNDKLSPAQRVWLDYLRNIGIDCEVCNVKNISSKSFL